MAIFTAAELEGWLKAGNFTGSVHDTNVTAVTAAVESSVIRYCGRSFEKIAVSSEAARVYGWTDQGSWRGIVSSTCAVVHDIWDITNLVVKTDDGDSGTYSTTWDSGDYQLEPLNHLEGDSYSPYWRIRSVNGRTFPRGKRSGLQVTAAWGWTAVPADVKQAALIKAARVFTRQTSPQGVAGFGEFGVVRISSKTDPDVADLLQPYRHPVMTALVG